MVKKMKAVVQTAKHQQRSQKHTADRVKKILKQASKVKGAIVKLSKKITKPNVNKERKMILSAAVAKKERKVAHARALKKKLRKLKKFGLSAKQLASPKVDKYVKQEENKLERAA